MYGTHWPSPASFPKGISGSSCQLDLAIDVGAAATTGNGVAVAATVAVFSGTMVFVAGSVAAGGVGESSKTGTEVSVIIGAAVMDTSGMVALAAGSVAANDVGDTGSGLIVAVAVIDVTGTVALAVGPLTVNDVGDKGSGLGLVVAVFVTVSTGLLVVVAVAGTGVDVNEGCTVRDGIVVAVIATEFPAVFWTVGTVVSVVASNATAEAGALLAVGFRSFGTAAVVDESSGGGVQGASGCVRPS